jgi:hypothetical protein
VVTLGALVLLILLCAFRQTTLLSLSENVLVTSIAQCIALFALLFKYKAYTLGHPGQAFTPSAVNSVPLHGGELKP